MKTKTIATIVLLAFVAASVVWLVVKETRDGRTKQEQGSGEKGADGGDKAPAVAKGKVTVYYFHQTARCMTCNRIEALTRQAVEGGFADEIKAGRIEIKAVNVEEPGNKHFADNYKLVTKSVVLVDGRKEKAGRWKNLDRVWELVRNEEAFGKYVQSEVKAFLAGK